jgi:hypothetical protein
LPHTPRAHALGHIADLYRQGTFDAIALAPDKRGDIPTIQRNIAPLGLSDPSRRLGRADLHAKDFAASRFRALHADTFGVTDRSALGGKIASGQFFHALDSFSLKFIFIMRISPFSYV